MTDHQTNPLTMARTPSIDLSRCTRCEACLELCPQVFVLNQAGYIEVTDFPQFSEDCVEEAIKYCPADCISWEDSL
jgi:ferredoxin